MSTTYVPICLLVGGLISESPRGTDELVDSVDIPMGIPSPSGSSVLPKLFHKSLMSGCGYLYLIQSASGKSLSEDS